MSAQDPMMLVGLAIVVVLVLFMLLRGGGGVVGGRRRNEIVLIGPGNAGKTTMFLKLRDGKSASAACVPSQRENRSTYKGPEGDTAAASSAANAGMVVVDTPGHPRLAAVRAEHLGSAKGVIIAIDSTDMGSIKAVAEHIFEVFTSKDVSSGGVKRILIASNKSELIFSKKPEVLLKALTDELKTIRRSNPEQAAECPGMGTDGDALDIRTILGAATPVEVVETSAKSGDIAAVHVFIKQVISA